MCFVVSGEVRRRRKVLEESDGEEDRRVPRRGTSCWLNVYRRVREGRSLLVYLMFGQVLSC